MAEFKLPSSNIEFGPRRDPLFIGDEQSIGLEHFYVPAHYQETLENILVPHGMISDRVEKLAYDITTDYSGNTIHLLCVLKGGSTFFHDLCTALKRCHDYSRQTHIPYTFDFIRVKSYEGTESTGKIQITGCELTHLKDKHVLFVEDIIDTGLTMTSLLKHMRDTIEPASVRVTSLVEKRTTRSCGFKADYVGFSIPDKFVVGYCLDFNEVYRDLNHLAVINKIKGMFSPVGKKKILLELKMGGTDPNEMGSLVGKKTNTPSNLVDQKAKKERGNFSPPRSSSPTKFSDSVASTNNLEIALADGGILGVVMNKILHSTTRYRPEKDGVVLKAFQSKCIEYERFRSYLYSVFLLAFTDEEFKVFLNYFDPEKIGVLNGYDFMIAFIKLGGIRKDREALLVREKQEMFLRKQKDEEDRKKLEADKKMELAADFDFTEEAKKMALYKVSIAATKFDPKHPSSPSLDCFNSSTMKAGELRETLKLTFNLKLDRIELGALLKEVGCDDDGQVSCSEFLRYFLRLGINGREKEKNDQRLRQAQLNEKAAKEMARKKAEADQKTLMEVDYNFEPEDEKKAMEKLQEASWKYDRGAPGSMSLDGFEVDALNSGDFKDLVRRVFNLTFTSTELGYIIQKYDVKKNGTVHSKTFLIDFLRLGQEIRYKMHSEQLDKQRKLDQQAVLASLRKIKEIQNSETIKIDDAYSDNDLKSGLDKLTKAAMFHDSERGASLISFEPASITPLEFKKALKRTFNITLTPAEMGAMVTYFDKDRKNKVNCQAFLTKFVALGAEERGRVHLEQLNACRDAEKKMKEDHIKKIAELASKTLNDVDFDYSMDDLKSAQEKTRVAATKFDSGHPAAPGLEGFECKFIKGGEFRELVRRTFHLKLTPKEVGAIFGHFATLKQMSKTSEADNIPIPTPTKPSNRGITGSTTARDAPVVDALDCGEFLNFFLQTGISERAKVHSQQLQKQRREDKERLQEEERKIKELTTRNNFEPDRKYSDEDKESIMEKLLIAAEGFDKNHPAAPSLEAFEVLHMPPGLFRENLKRVFNIIATPKEMAYLMDSYDPQKIGEVDSKQFLISFIQMGKRERDAKRRAFLESSRDAIRRAKAEEEAKLAAQWSKAELRVDYNFSDEDFESAVIKMTIASTRYDKAHPAAPCLDGFTGGPIKPGEFRELMKSAFKVMLNPRELGALVSRYLHPGEVAMIDGKKFLIAFMKLGFDERARVKAETLQQQRRAKAERIKEAERKLVEAQQRVVVEIDPEFTKEDQTEAFRKLTSASAMYDKNSPGSPSLDAFCALFLTPAAFREVLKSAFNVNFTTKELSSLVHEFSDGAGNVECAKFMVAFIKMGSEERDKVKKLQLEKQRRMNFLRKTEHERKMKEAEDKVALKVSYTYSNEEKEAAFEKLTIAAKKYDRSHPGSMSLDGFEEKQLKPHVFREMLKRTFGIFLTSGELGACMHYYDIKGTGTVPSKKFLIHFLKLGIAERNRDHSETLTKLRDDAAMREREEREKLAAQWAKMEFKIAAEYTPEERATALEKLADAAGKFDPASPGPMGLTAFEAKTLSPAIFREMLRRSFNLKVTDAELAALVAEFDKFGNKTVVCSDFMVRFTTMGSEKRDAARLAQLEKQRKMSAAAQVEAAAKKKALDNKLEIDETEMKFELDDLESALEKIRLLASKYDRSHPSAPSLQGFVGTDMRPTEFKNMMMRTFNTPMSSKELGALVEYFNANNPSVLNGTGAPSPGLINTQGFLTYFNRIQREEQAKRNSDRIERDREAVRQQLEMKRLQQLKKQQDGLNLLIFGPEDEVTCLAKIRKAAQEYAIDTALFVEPLQGFKGPAMPPDSFRDIFNKVFQIRLTYPEVGVLLSILDVGGNGALDGAKFVNWFFKISRKEEKFMLGESMNPVTMETLKLTTMSITNNQPVGTFSAAGTQKMNVESFSRPPSQSYASNNMPSPSTHNALMSPNNRPEKSKTLSGIPQTSFGRRSTTEDSEEVDESWRRTDSQTMLSVAESMVSQSWFLPSLTASTNFDNISMQGSSMVVTDENSLWGEAESKRNFLRSIFDSDGSDLLGDFWLQAEQSTRDDEDGNNGRRRKREVGPSNNNAALYQSSRNLLATPALSVSLGDSRPCSSSSDGKISRQQLSLPGVETYPAGQNSEKTFLFLNNLLTSENKELNESSKSSAAASGATKKKNPVLKLNKIKQHFTESPIALMNKKQQRELKQHPAAQSKKNVSRDDAKNKNIENSTGGFFFASLLGSSLKTAPNIGPTTFPHIDDEDIRSLFLSASPQAASEIEMVNNVAEIQQGNDVVEPLQQLQESQEVIAAEEVQASSPSPQQNTVSTAVEETAPSATATATGMEEDLKQIDAVFVRPVAEENAPVQVLSSPKLSLLETFPAGAKLTAHVVRIVASKLRNVELIGKNDPYVLLNFHGGKWKAKTTVIDNGGSEAEWSFPESDPAMRFVLSAEDLQTGALEAQVMDSNSLRKHVQIGFAETTLSESEETYESIDRSQGQLIKNISLKEKSGQFAGYLEIHIKLVRNG